MKKAAFLLLTFALCINHVFGDDNFNHPTDTIFINPLAQNSSQTGTRQNPWLGFKSPYSMPDHKTYAIKGGTTIYTTSTVQFLGHELITITSYDTTGVGPARIYKTTPDSRLMYVSGSEDGPNGININAVVRVKDLILYHVGRHSVNDNTGETLTIRMYGGKAIVDNVHTTGGHQGINISGYSTPDIVEAYVMNCSIDSTFDDSMYHSRLKSLHILNCKTTKCGLFWPDHLVQPNGDGTQTWEVRNILIENSTLDRSATGGKFAVIGTETLSQYHIKNSLLIGHFFENRPGIDSISAVVYKGNGSWIFENSIIVDARFGIWNFGTNLQIDNCLFVGQNIAVQALTANNTIINSTFANIGKRQYYYPQNSVFHEASGSQILYVSNCNFVNYNRLFLAIGSSVVRNFNGNNYFNYAVNEAGQYGTAFTTEDPLFEEEIYYQLSEQSPLKNAGPNGRDVGFSLIESGPIGYKGLIKANGSGTNNTQFTISLSANPVSAGTYTGGGTFIQGTQATVTATANTGYSFANWKEGNTVVSTNPAYSFEVTANRNLVANFQAIQYTISASANPTQGGSTSGAGTYNHGSQVSLTATANSGYSFVNWKEGNTVVSTNANYSFTATANRTLTANFSQQQYTIAASANPVEGGSTTGAGSFNHGAQVSLTATANSGYSFVNWKEGNTVVSTNANYSFTATANRTLTANFSQQQYTIAASANPVEGGSTTGAGSYNHGAQVSLTATANSGYSFVNWKEGNTVVSTNANYSFTATANRTLTANFSQQQYTIAASANPVEGGSTTGAGSYNHGAQVSLTASANTGWNFISWLEDGTVVSTSPVYEFLITESRSLTASFSQDQYGINLTAEPAEGGSLSGGGAYNYGQTATVIAQPNSGWEFNAWLENGIVVSQDNEYSFEVTGNRSLSASFTQSMFQLSLQASPEEGGNVSGDGSFVKNSMVSVMASPNNGWVFLYWTEEGIILSNSPEYEFMLSSDKLLVAHFAPVQVNINVNIEESQAGFVYGGGVYDYGDNVILEAAPVNGYSFAFWKENEQAVSYDATYQFSAQQDRDLIAVFQVTSNVYYVMNISSIGNGYTNPPSNQYTHTAGSVLMLEAYPVEGWVFESWDVNGTTFKSQNLQINVGENLNIVAIFALATSIPDVEESQEINVFPNPAQSVLNISLNNYNGPTSIEIINLQGQTLQALSNAYQGAGESISFDVNDLKPGIYIIRIINQGKITARKFTKS